MISAELKKTPKYLGMIVDGSLTWGDHIDYITLKINGGIGVIRKVRQLIPEKALLLLYQTLINPYFRYCSTVQRQCGETLKINYRYYRPELLGALQK